MHPGERGHFLAITRHSRCLKATLAECLKGEMVWDVGVKKKVKVTLNQGRGVGSESRINGIKVCEVHGNQSSGFH